MEPNITTQTTPEIQTPITEPAPSVPSNPSSKTKYIILGVLILFILVAISGGTYYLGVVKQQSASQKNINVVTATTTPTALPNPTQTPISTTDPTANWKSYTGTSFSFKYPNSLIKCCSISGPTTVNATDALITLGEFQTVPVNGNSSPFNGFAVYLISMSNFDSLIAQEKDTLIKNSAAISGINTQGKGTQSQIIIGGKNGILLSNYSWDNIQRIYVPISSQNTLVIAKTEKTPESFVDFLSLIHI